SCAGEVLEYLPLPLLLDGRRRLCHRGRHVARERRHAVGLGTDVPDRERKDRGDLAARDVDRREVVERGYSRLTPRVHLAVTRRAGESRLPRLWSCPRLGGFHPPYSNAESASRRRCR